MKLSFEREVEARLDGRPHLLPLFDHVLRIPQRVWEYRPTLFVVINAIRNLEKAMGVPAEDLTRVPQGILPRYGAWLEIHDLAQPGNTHALTVPYGALDARILRDLWQSDIRVRGDLVFREIDRHNERLEESRRRAQRNVAGALARESRLAFANASWGTSIFGPR